MKIQAPNRGPQRPERVRDVESPAVNRLDRLRGLSGLPAERGDGHAEPPSAPAVKYDRVEISDAGRAKASLRLEPTAPGLSDRLAEVRRRVLGGAYESSQVVADVAHRMLDRGDV